MLNKIGIIFGGNSTEHDASIHSYLNVLSSYISENKLQCILKVIYIKNKNIYIFNEDFPKNEDKFCSGQKKILGDIIHELKNLYWLSLLHGNEGEDGAYQGLSEIFNIRGSFGKLLPAVISMNKWIMSDLVQNVTKNAIHSIPYIILRKNSIHESVIHDFLKKNPSEFYVIKPNSLGASLFSHKIHGVNIFEFIRSKDFNKIFKYDANVLLQKYIEGREFTFGLIQNKDNLINLPIVEIFTKNNFLGHKEKHSKGYVRVTFNEVEEPLKAKIILNSKFIFNYFNFSNFCRFDYILSNGKIFFLEANSIPGLMSCSIFTKMLQLAGYTIPKIVDFFVNNKSSYLNKKFRYEIK